MCVDVLVSPSGMGRCHFYYVNEPKKGNDSGWVPFFGKFFWGPVLLFFSCAPTAAKKEKQGVQPYIPVKGLGPMQPR